MSIDWLYDLERSLEFGREFFACPAGGKNQWTISKDKDQLVQNAQLLADQKGIPVSVYRLASKSEAVLGCFFLVPISIEETGPKGEPQILWSLVETKDAAELIRDLKYGASPYFTAIEIATLNPKTTAKKQ
ncbi:MAG: hypothetical protein NZT61_01055 [Deltaproteobacteria bacterium]|nr:hypothetical protein [Deltaproteobacteria bacterium]MCX7952081.1 hypothetical protein [Deltaproteobacteria bacterium]